MILDEPLLDPNSDYKKALYIIDVLVTSIYIGEACIKIIGNGFICNKYSYMRDPLNILDFLSLIISL